MFDFCEDIAQVPQPELSLVGALALASVTCGRLYRTNMNNFSSMYFMGVAKSGTRVKKTSKHLLNLY